jgi:hypothetical protein
LCCNQFAFPSKLYALLEDAARNGNDDIIAWQSDGKAFQIHKPKEFAEVLMANYFDQIKYRSFQRQLHNYGFRLLKKNGNHAVQRGEYFHKLFVRGEQDLCLQIMTRRKKTRGNEVHDSDGFHHCGLRNIRTSSCLQSVSQLGQKRIQNLQIVPSRREVSGPQPPSLPATEANGSSEKQSVEDDEVLRLKRRFDDMFECIQKAETRKNYVAPPNEDLREGDEIIFEGKRFHFVEWNMEKTSPVAEQGPHSSLPSRKATDYSEAYGRVVLSSERRALRDIDTGTAAANPAA